MNTDIRNYTVFLFIFFLITQTFDGFSQAKDEASVIAAARAQLDEMSSPEGELTKFFTKNNITGEFVFDMTLQGKGDVVTVFMVSRNAGKARENTIFKDKMHSLKFRDIKIAKKQRVKFRHTLTF